ncbi:MAG: hypothetical protein AAF489_07155 [Bacteroidota bacterium]
MAQWFYKLCLIALIWSLQKANVELSFGVSLAVAVLCFRKNISSSAALLLILLFGLVLIGSITVLNPENDYYYFTKDLVYFLRPMTVIASGYFITMRLENKRSFLNIIVLMGFYFAFMHLFKMAANFTIIPADTTRIRTYFGRYNHVESLALIIIICVKELPMKKSRYKFFYQVMVAMLAVSFLFYFSRTMILVVISMSMAYYGYLKLNQKSAIVLAGMLILGSIGIAILSNYEPEKENGVVVDSFFSKLKNSFDESFSLKNVDVTSLDRRVLWKHWRAYEAHMVYGEVDKAEQWLTGQGFGSTVDIGFEAKLDGEMTQHLSLTHNGFAYLYLKTGIFGLIIYFLMVLYLYSFAYASQRNKLQIIGNNLLVACTFYILISSFVVTGIFKPYDMATLVIGGAFALKQTRLENRNNRNEGDT